MSKVRPTEDHQTLDFRKRKEKVFRGGSSVVGVGLFHNDAIFHFQKNAFTIWLTVVFGIHEKSQLIFVVAPDGGTVPGSVSGVVFDQDLDNLLSGHAFLDLVIEAAIGSESWINDPGIESEEKEDRRDEDSTSGEDE